MILERDGEAGEWQTFQKAANQDGEKVILEYLKVGSMRSRKNPKLAADTTIPWPWNLEVAYVKETWKDTQRTVDVGRMRTSQDDDIEIVASN